MATTNNNNKYIQYSMSVLLFCTFYFKCYVKKKMMHAVTPDATVTLFGFFRLNFTKAGEKTVGQQARKSDK